MSKKRRLILIFFLTPIVLCLATLLVSWISNQSLPEPPARLEVLDPLDKARLGESQRLRQVHGEALFPGFGQAAVPLILWNQDYEFLVGLADPSQLPADWKVVPGDDYLGAPYYRRPAANPQNFAVEVGEALAASMATKWETDRFMMEMFQGVLPYPLELFFPYRLLIMPSEVQICAVVHESFHVYQTLQVPELLSQAESAHRLGEAYWQHEAATQPDWRTEIDLLAKALQTEDDAQAAEWARQFLAARQQRRQASQQASDPSDRSDLIDYERWLEWEEGLAKYTELAAWQLAYQSNESALPALAADPDFQGYRTFPQRWSQEISQMKRQASQEGETRFYYTGMAQAFLLDRLSLGWKAQVFTPEAWLESLLETALK